MRSEGYFLENLEDFTQTSPSAHFGIRKIVKKQNIKKSLLEIVAKTLRYIYTNF